MVAAKKLAMNLAYLGAQLELLNSSQVRCWDYERPLWGATELAHFLGQAPTAFERALRETYERSEPLLEEEDFEVGRKMHEKLHAKWCA